MAQYAFRLYEHPEINPVEVAGPSVGQNDSPSDQFIHAWMDRFGGFDYGALTVWLMRGFGLPNVRSYDTFKHSFCWGLETPEGYVIEVEPGLRKIRPDEYGQALETREEGAKWSKADFARSLRSGAVFRLSAVRADAPPVTPALMSKWLDQFERPIYVRDVGANVLGPLLEQNKPDLGPGDESVLDGGAELADTPCLPQ